MYITDMSLLNAKLSAAGVISESNIIKYILEEDVSNKKDMFLGEKYYNAEQDSIHKQYNEVTVSETEETDGYEKEVMRTFKNPNRSNHHNVNCFHRLLVDQKVSYIAGREPTISVSGSETNKTLKPYADMVSEAADENFNEVLQDWITGASNKGYEVLHFYYDNEGELKYCIVPAEEVILIYDSAFQRELEQVIRYYTVKVVKGGVEYLRRKVEWWTKENITYYAEKEENIFVLDPDYPVNPLPHWYDINLINGMEKRRTPHFWGRVPFIVLENNRNRTTDLKPVKGLIDAYDYISSEGTNNLLELVELYWVIQDYGGETAGAIARKLQINRAVNITDSSGNVEAKQVSLPVNERIEFLKMLRHDIYHFGMGIDVDNENFGTAPSGVALQFRYANLRHKCENMVPRLKRAIKEFFWFITEDYNRKNGTAFDSSKIKVTINYSQIANDAETVSIINQSEGIISRKTQLENHPFVTDVNEEIKRLEEEENKAQESYGHINMNPPLKDGGGDEQ